MLDKVMKNMIKDNLTELHTTMKCTVISVAPLRIKPIPVKHYVTGDQEYPIIENPKKLKEWTLQFGDVYPNSDYVTDETTFSGGTPVSFSYPLFVGDVVLVAFAKDNLADAVILGVLDE